jgi:hypothetical protein
MAAAPTTVGVQNPAYRLAPLQTARVGRMTCPYCNSENVVQNVTVRWSQVRGVFVPKRGHYCTTCGKSFDPPASDGLSLSTVILEEVTPAIRKLQESGDVIVVRHRDGVHEVIY